MVGHKLFPGHGGEDDVLVPKLVDPAALAADINVSSGLLQQCGPRQGRLGVSPSYTLAIRLYGSSR